MFFLYILQNSYKIEKTSRILLIIIIVAIMYNHALWPLSIVGVLLQLGIYLIESKCDKQQEIFLIMLWILISILSTFSEFYSSKTNSFILLISSNFVAEHFVRIFIHFVTCLNNVCLLRKYKFFNYYLQIKALGSIIGIMNIRRNWFKMARKNLTFKKLDVSTNSSESEPHLFSSRSTETLKVSSTPENLIDTSVPVYKSQLLKNNR